jgi:hypothetical protein
MPNCQRSVRVLLVAMRITHRRQLARLALGSISVCRSDAIHHGSDSRDFPVVIGTYTYLGGHSAMRVQRYGEADSVHAMAGLCHLQSGL